MLKYSDDGCLTTAVKVIKFQKFSKSTSTFFLRKTIEGIKNGVIMTSESLKRNHKQREQIRLPKRTYRVNYGLPKFVRVATHTK